MQYTAKLNLQKPQSDTMIPDAFNAINANADTIDGILSAGWQTVTLTTTDIPAFVDRVATIPIPHTAHRCIIGGTIIATLGGYAHTENSRYVFMSIASTTPAEVLRVDTKYISGSSYSGDYKVQLVPLSQYIHSVVIDNSDGYGVGNVWLELSSGGINLKIKKYAQYTSYNATLSATLYVLPI